MIFCIDCGKFHTDEETVYATLDAYDDGELTQLCPYCGGDSLAEFDEDAGKER